MKQQACEAISRPFGNGQQSVHGVQVIAPKRKPYLKVVTFTYSYFVCNFPTHDHLKPNWTFSRCQLQSINEISSLSHLAILSWQGIFQLIISYLLRLVTHWYRDGSRKAAVWIGVSSQWDNVSVTGRARGGRTHRDTEEGEAEEQTAKVFAFLARESSDFCRA